MPTFANPPLFDATLERIYLATDALNSISCDAPSAAFDAAAAQIAFAEANLRSYITLCVDNAVLRDRLTRPLY